MKIKKKLELVLRYRVTPRMEVTEDGAPAVMGSHWELFTQEGKFLGPLCPHGVDELFELSNQAMKGSCIILEIGAHEAEWTGPKRDD